MTTTRNTKADCIYVAALDAFEAFRNHLKIRLEVADRLNDHRGACGIHDALAALRRHELSFIAKATE